MIPVETNYVQRIFPRIFICVAAQHVADGVRMISESSATQIKSC